LLLLLPLFSGSESQSQGVSISSGSNLFIGAGATVSLDSLVLRPTTNFNLTGLRREYRNTAVVHTLSRPYIKRVYHFSTTTPVYSGAISIYYRDAELNTIAESALTLNVHNGSTWNVYSTGVTRNSTANVVTTTGLSSVPLNELTLASNAAALLTMNKSISDGEVEAGVAVYPNPVQEHATVQITAPEASTATLQLYDSKGELLLTQQAALLKGSNQVPLDLQTFAKGSYTLTLNWNYSSKTIMLIKQ